MTAMPHHRSPLVAGAPGATAGGVPGPAGVPGPVVSVGVPVAGAAGGVPGPAGAPGPAVPAGGCGGPTAGTAPSGRRADEADAGRAGHGCGSGSGTAWGPDRALAIRCLAARAARRGARWPRVAAAVTAVRGVSGEDRAGFAARFRLDLPALEALEGGLVPARDVPPFLRHHGAFVDWVWVAAG